MPHNSSKEAISLASAIEKDAESLGLIDKPKYDWLTLFDILVVEEPLRSTTRNLFKDGYYALSVEEAYKCFNNWVKARSWYSDKDGAPLMTEVFSLNKPLLKLNSLKTKSEQDQQLGYMTIFSGCMTGIRNPRAHEHRYLDAPEVALELLTFANHIFRMVRLAKPLKGGKMPNIESIQSDLSVLAEQANEDVKAKRWVSYLTHVPAYNRLFEACKQVGVDVEGLGPIETVPENNRGVAGPGSAEEQAKVSEVARKASQLHRRALQFHH